MPKKGEKSRIGGWGLWWEHPLKGWGGEIIKEKSEETLGTQENATLLSEGGEREDVAERARRIDIGHYTPGRF